VVTITGTVVSGEGSPYYRTFYALDVTSIRTRGGHVINPGDPGASRPQAPENSLRAYHARFQATTNPDRILVAAWRDSGATLDPADIYVPYHVNGSDEFATFGCADGFAISEVKTDSALRPLNLKTAVRR